MGGRLLEVTAYQRNEIGREIGRIVAEAAQGGRMLRIGPLASDLADSHSHSGLAAAQIADQLALAAARAGVAMEISRPRGVRLVRGLPLAGTAPSPPAPR